PGAGRPALRAARRAGLRRRRAGRDPRHRRRRAGAPARRRVAAGRTRLGAGRRGARAVRGRRLRRGRDRTRPGAARPRHARPLPARGRLLDSPDAFRRTPPMRTLYPEVEPFDTGKLEVDGRHTLHYEQCGNPDGKPVVLLHGGPGGGCSAKMRRFHDPAKYRIVLFDQRGAGRSTPHADLADNTTWDLVEDIEELRVRLGIGKWQGFGGCWRSTGAVASAPTHPERVAGLAVGSVSLLPRWELAWLSQGGASRLFPE